MLNNYEITFDEKLIDKIGSKIIIQPLVKSIYHGLKNIKKRKWLDKNNSETGGGLY